MKKSKKERPMVALSGISAKNDGSHIYANLAGLVKLQSALIELIAGRSDKVTIPVLYEKNNWNNLTISVSTLSDFEGDKRCSCGCQDKFNEVAAQYK